MINEKIILIKIRGTIDKQIDERNFNFSENVLNTVFNYPCSCKPINIQQYFLYKILLPVISNEELQMCGFNDHIINQLRFNQKEETYE